MERFALGVTFFLQLVTRSVRRGHGGGEVYAAHFTENAEQPNFSFNALVLKAPFAEIPVSVST